MKTFSLIFLLIFVLNSSGYASEEDFAVVTSLQLAAKMPCEMFGQVIVEAETANGQEGPGLSFLAVTWKNSKSKVPEDILQTILRVNLSTLTVSCELGYPDKGIGPHLYIRFLGYDGTKQAHYRVIFGLEGYKELRKED